MISVSLCEQASRSTRQLGARHSAHKNGCVLSMSSDEWLFDLMKEYWMDPCTAVVRPYSPAELQAHNLCAAVPPMIFMFALVGFVSLMAYLESRRGGPLQKQKKS